MPLSLERLQSGSDLVFVERSIANNLAPNRDVGVQLFGDVLDGALSYQLGGFNGGFDGSNIDGDTTSDKEVAGRLFAEPFKQTDLTPLATSKDVTVLADGNRTRWAPGGYYYWGPLGLMGEYIFSSQGVLREDAKANTTRRHTFDNRGWFAQGSYVLTGEDASYWSVTPINPFDPRNGRWGAFELAPRGSEVDVDEDAFDLGFADRSKATSGAVSYGGGLNWYLNKNFKFQVNYERTEFDTELTFGKDARDHEDVLLTRFQISY